MKKVNILIFIIIVFLMPSAIHSMDAPIINLCDNIKFFLKLRSINKHFNELLTVEQIGQVCTSYDQEVKDNTLKTILEINEYAKLRFLSLILVHAKANPDTVLDSEYRSQILLKQALYRVDVPFITTLLQHKAKPNEFYGDFPVLFYAKTKECAQLLVEHGANIHITDKENKTNILWSLIDGYGFLKNHRLDLFQFYLEKGVSPKMLRPSDNACLFHHLSNFSYNSNISVQEYNKTKFAKILFNKIPTMVNALNASGETPLDTAIKRKKYYKDLADEIDNVSLYLKNMKNFIVFLRKHDAKTAEELFADIG